MPDIYGIEIIIIDNSSKDDTFEIAKNELIHHQNYILCKIKHCTLTVSRNVGWNLSNSDYVAYIDADGFVLDSYVAELVDVISANEPDIISGSVSEAGDDQNYFYKFHYQTVMEITSNYLLGANMCFRRSVLQELDGFPEITLKRGDESGLMCEVYRQKPNAKHVYNDEMITYNHFINRAGQFLSSQIQEGWNSCALAKIYSSKTKVFFTTLYRCLLPTAVSSLGLGMIFSSTVLVVAALALIALRYLRMMVYFKKLMRKLARSPSPKAVWVALTVLVHPFFFDFGYLGQLLSSKASDPTTGKTEILERIDGWNI